MTLESQWLLVLETFASVHGARGLSRFAAAVSSHDCSGLCSLHLPRVGTQAEGDGTCHSRAEGRSERAGRSSVQWTEEDCQVLPPLGGGVGGLIFLP